MTDKPAYKRILLKLSGEALMGEEMAGEAREIDLIVREVSVEAAVAEITTNWNAFFNPSTPNSKRVQLLQNGSQFTAAISAFASSPLAAAVTSKVDSVTLSSATAAKVKYDLSAMGTTVLRTGAVGSGQAMKALNNLVSSGGFLIGIEALLIGQRFGLDPAVMVDVLNAATGNFLAESFRDPVVYKSQNTTPGAYPAYPGQLVFSPTGKALAEDGTAGDVFLWHLFGGAPDVVTRTDGTSSVQVMAFSPDGKTLALVYPRGVRLWDVATRSPGAPLA